MKILNTIKPQMLDRNALAFPQESKYGTDSLRSLGGCSVEMQAMPNTLDCIEVKKSSPIFGPYVSGTSYGQEYAEVEPVFNVGMDVVARSVNMVAMICPYTRLQEMSLRHMYDLISRTFQPMNSNTTLFRGKDGYAIKNTDTQVIGLAGSVLKLSQYNAGASGKTVTHSYAAGSVGTLTGPKSTRYGYIRNSQLIGTSEITRMGRKTQELSIYTHLSVRSYGSSKPVYYKPDQVMIFFPDAEAGEVSQTRPHVHNARIFKPSEDAIGFGDCRYRSSISVYRLNLRLKDVHFNKVIL